MEKSRNLSLNTLKVEKLSYLLGAAPLYLKPFFIHFFLNIRPSAAVLSKTPHIAVSIF